MEQLSDTRKKYFKRFKSQGGTDLKTATVFQFCKQQWTNSGQACSKKNFEGFIYTKVYRCVCMYMHMSTHSLILPLLTLVEQNTIPHI